MLLNIAARCKKALRCLTGDTGGVALIEFAFAMPILIAFGFGGVEIANLSVANLRVSHAAIDLADNTARMGRQSTSTGYQTLTESDINDAIQALRLEMPDIATNGRVTISSIEARTDGNGNVTQFLHWQRCVGLQPVAPLTAAAYESSSVVPVGASTSNNTAAPTDDSGKTVAGIGSPTLTAPSGSGLMFVEINYNYTSMFSSIPILNALLAGTKKLHYVSAMIVRQTRSTYDTIDNSAKVTRMTCDKHTN